MITEAHKTALDKLLAQCVEHEELFTDWETGYINDWVEKIEAKGCNVTITDKQQGIFDRLQDKLNKEGL